MKRIVAVPAALVVAAVAIWTGPAAGWASANRYGGSTTHSYGDTSHDQRLWRQFDARNGSRHRAHQHVRRQHRTCRGRRHGAHQRLRRHDRRCGRRRRGAYDAYGGRPAPTAHATPALPRCCGLSGLSPAGCGAVLRRGLLAVPLAAGAVVGVAAGAAVASANTAAATSNRVQRRCGYRRGCRECASRRTCNGRQLRRAARRVDGDQQERRDVLHKWQYLVPAGLRRERRLLPSNPNALDACVVLPTAENGLASIPSN